MTGTDGTAAIIIRGALWLTLAACYFHYYGDILACDYYRLNVTSNYDTVSVFTRLKLWLTQDIVVVIILGALWLELGAYHCYGAIVASYYGGIVACHCYEAIVDVIKGTENGNGGQWLALLWGAPWEYFAKVLSALHIHMYFYGIGD